MGELLQFKRPAKVEPKGPTYICSRCRRPCKVAFVALASLWNKLTFDLNLCMDCLDEARHLF